MKNEKEDLVIKEVRSKNEIEKTNKIAEDIKKTIPRWKKIQVFDYNAKLVLNNGITILYPLSICGDDEKVSRYRLEKYLEENQEDVGLVYERVESIINTGSSFLLIDPSSVLTDKK